jgi:hypothetical protein
VIIIQPYSSEDLKKLKELTNSQYYNHKIGYSTDIATIYNAFDMGFEVTAIDYWIFEENLVNTGVSVWLGSNYVLIAKLFRMPLEEMPLFINDKNSAVRMIAKWRLEIGK